MVQLSIIIVNYNVRDLLMNAVASLKNALDGISGEIIVVDNASSDGAVEALQREHPDVITIPLERNLGFGAGNNVGIERSRGEFVLLINPDTVVQENTLRTMMDFMAAHPEAGLAGCKILNPDGSFEPASKRGFPSPWSAFSRVFGLSRLFPKSKLFGGYNLTWLDPDTTAEVEALSGCFMFFRGDVLRRLDGFDTDFFMYGEDLDLCWRTKKEGWRIWYHPATSIMHLKGESTRRSSLDAIAMFYDAMEIFARKHFRRNLPLLWLMRAGIALRKGIARIGRRYPRLDLALVDFLAVLVGFVVSTVIKVGSLTYPDYAIPWAFIAPPIAFIGAIALAGGYGPEYGRLSRTLLGYLGGFFVLSTLPYFFEAYRFSRGIVLATTGLAVGLGLTVRFLLLLYERTFGGNSARRVAFISREDVGTGMRDRAARLFLGRPIKIMGVIAPTFSGLDEIGGRGLGTIENIARIVREHELTDVVVVDSEIGYGDVIRAIRHTAGESVRFHLLRGEHAEMGDETLSRTVTVRRTREPYRLKLPLSKRLLDRLLALVCLVLVPAVYWARRPGSITLRSLLEALAGKRPLVRGAAGPAGEPEPVFTAAALYGGDGPGEQEMAEIERYYEANRSFMLDCEIIVTTLRFSTGGAEVRVKEPRVGTN